jgi:hypothetical protein
VWGRLAGNNDAMAQQLGCALTPLWRRGPVVRFKPVGGLGRIATFEALHYRWIGRMIVVSG